MKQEPKNPIEELQTTGMVSGENPQKQAPSPVVEEAAERIADLFYRQCMAMNRQVRQPRHH